MLIAPPGAGKTTGVAPALLAEPWCTGQVLLLSPRRVAAGAAAERMAEALQENVGETVGYLTRLDSRHGSKTRILVMTEAIFVNRILDDPELAGVSAVLFDEAHERHLDSDLGLALALESAAVVREDLRLLVMSATLDGRRFADLLGPGAPLIESAGRSFPLRIEWFGSDPAARLEDHVASAVSAAWRAEEGDMLVFLPGVGEIERVRERLVQRIPDALVLPLHGQIDGAAQRRATRRDRDGRRRIVLATAIAETSLTLDGVSIVVDAGLSRRAEYDRAAGTTHLVTGRASQASATQRAGRAARQGPGVAYRLWAEGGHAGRPAFDPPEVTTADLAPMMLSLAKWGTADPDELRWIDAPPAASVAAARRRLERIGALEDGRISERGERIAALPLAPAMAAALLSGAEHGQTEAVARLALLTQERDLGGRGEDLLWRLARWDADRSPRAAASRKLAKRWAMAADRMVGSPISEPIAPALHLARALPDRIARRRDAAGEDWLSAGGRGFRLDPASPLARAEWLVVTDAVGQARGARITAAAQLDAAAIEGDLADIVERRSVLHWNADRARVEPRLEQRFGAILLARGADPSPDEQAVADLLAETFVADLCTLLPADLMARAAYTGIGALSLDRLRETTDHWLVPLLQGRRSLDIPRERLIDALLAMLDWNERQRLDREAPREFLSPAGTVHRIDYTGDDAPSVEVRVQALFGLDRHPMVGTTPLLLKLTSPAGRPVQSTRDLPGFWRGSWADVARDMKGRYPKHRWPDEPWTEAPSLKTKNAFAKSGG